MAALNNDFFVYIFVCGGNLKNLEGDGAELLRVVLLQCLLGLDDNGPDGKGNDCQGELTPNLGGIDCKTHNTQLDNMILLTSSEDQAPTLNPSCLIVIF